MGRNNEKYRFLSYTSDVNNTVINVSYNGQ